MALRLYNSLTRAVEPVRPREAGRVGIYVCGMTPSFHPHLGHARTFMTFDVLRRHLRNRGYDVTYVQNVTDIEDKIIERSAAEGVPWERIVERYYGEYRACAARLSIAAPDVEPYATKEMDTIVSLVKALVDKGDAYETADGVYFSVARFPRYSELSHREIDELRAGARVDKREQKREPIDFALWKKAKPGEPTWPSPWGPGRPGWHIECSAMARRYLGEQFDIHGGATDLIFPHHENEVAQTESLTGKHPMARVWMHAGLLMVDGQKMSKSLGNFVPLTSLLDRHPPAAIRFLFLQTGYRKPTNFTEDSVGGATIGLKRLYAQLDFLRDAAAREAAAQPSVSDTGAFDDFLDDDLNTAGAVGWMLRAVETAAAEVRSGGVDPAQAVATAERCLATLGLPRSADAAGLPTVREVTLGGTQTAYVVRTTMPNPEDLKLPDEVRARFLQELDGASAGPAGDAAIVQALSNLRDALRKKKMFGEADRLRSMLAEAGISLTDTPAGVIWSVNGAR